MRRFFLRFVIVGVIFGGGRLQAQDFHEMSNRQSEMESELRELRGRIEVLEHRLEKGDPSASSSSSDAETDDLPGDPSEEQGQEQGAPPEEDDVQADGTHFLKPHYKKNASKVPPPRGEREEPSVQEKKALQAPEDVLKKARDLMTERKYAASEKLLRKLVKEHEKDQLSIEAFYWLGEIHFINDQYESAAVSFGDSYALYGQLKGKNPALKENSRAANSLIQLARCLNKLGKKKQAEATLGQVTKEFSNHPRKMIGRMVERARREIENRPSKSPAS